MDTFFAVHAEPLKSSELQLTAVTCLFISAKNIMVEPFTLDRATEILCFSKYTTPQFLKREADIRSSLSYINELINIGDYL